MRHVLGFLNTPPLWEKEQFGLMQFELPSIDLTNFVPQPISTRLRLGHQVEYICKQLLDHSDRYEVLAHNIQIKKGKNTIGELDFLLKDQLDQNKPQRTLHIELTYKFYIIETGVTEPLHRLIGPNRKDAFFTKIEKTRTKQLPLLYTEECRETLKDLHIDFKAILQQTYFLAQLFTEYGKEETTSIGSLNKDCIVGFWMRFKTLKTTQFEIYEFYITLKNEWLHTPHPAVKWKSHSEILIAITTKHTDYRAPLIWIKKPDTIEKGFVVWW